MATVPKVFTEQKYTRIFLLKFRHQSMIRDMYQLHKICNTRVERERMEEEEEERERKEERREDNALKRS